MDELQGVWRVQGVRLRGGEVYTQQTHLVVDGSSWREVWDRVLYADEPRPETTFAVDGEHLQLATTWHQPDGSAHGPFRGTWAYELDGDVLRTCSAGYELVPARVDELEGTVTTYERVRDAEEIARIAAPPVIRDKPTRQHPELGELRWDANLGWYKTADGEIALAVAMDAPLDAHAARALALRADAARLAEAAADELLDTHNASWREPGEPAETRGGFAARLALQGITVYADRNAEVYFEDGGLFWGHIVVVSVDADGQPTGADIAG